MVGIVRCTTTSVDMMTNILRIIPSLAMEAIKADTAALPLVGARGGNKGCMASLIKDTLKTPTISIPLRRPTLVALGSTLLRVAMEGLHLAVSVTTDAPGLRSRQRASRVTVVRVNIICPTFLGARSPATQDQTNPSISQIISRALLLAETILTKTPFVPTTPPRKAVPTDLVHHSDSQVADDLAQACSRTCLLKVSSRAMVRIRCMGNSTLVSMVHLQADWAVITNPRHQAAASLTKPADTAGTEPALVATMAIMLAEVGPGITGIKTGKKKGQGSN